MEGEEEREGRWRGKEEEEAEEEEDEEKRDRDPIQILSPLVHRDVRPCNDLAEVRVPRLQVPSVPGRCWGTTAGPNPPQ